MANGKRTKSPNRNKATTTTTTTTTTNNEGQQGGRGDWGKLIKVIIIIIIRIIIMSGMYYMCVIRKEHKRKEKNKIDVQTFKKRQSEVNPHGKMFVHCWAWHWAVCLC